jgi:hypothetical protein
MAVHIFCCESTASSRLWDFVTTVTLTVKRKVQSIVCSVAVAFMKCSHLETHVHFTGWLFSGHWFEEIMAPLDIHSC